MLRWLSVCIWQLEHPLQQVLYKTNMYYESFSPFLSLPPSLHFPLSSLFLYLLPLPSLLSVFLTVFPSLFLCLLPLPLSPLSKADLKQVAQAISGIDLHDRLVTMIFILFDENSSQHTLYPSLIPILIY